MKAECVSSDVIRATFARALSDMYKREMPRYRVMGDVVAKINRDALSANVALEHELRENGEFDQLDAERHGAIRLGASRELADMRRLFAVMGMFPVGYYNLSPAGIPVHSTAFRPIDPSELRRSPFRVFTSLLRSELIDDAKLRREAIAILKRRDILTPRCRELLRQFESDGGFDEVRANELVAEAVETFRWRPEATVSAAVYEKLYAAHPLIADIACFKGPHINHLTLSTLDIDTAQRAMATHGMNPKAVIEGPSRRRCPILLRQTSFKAAPEPILFAGEQTARVFHTARFGEIEQRGVALTEKGRALYDRLLLGLSARAQPPETESDALRGELNRSFEKFPDDAATMHREGLAFYRIHPTEKGLAARGDHSLSCKIDVLLAAGIIRLEPIIYQDFLPASAAGIFRSNLADAGSGGIVGDDDRAGFEEALGAPLADFDALYREEQAASHVATLAALQINISETQKKSC